MANDSILSEKRGPVGLLTINRPKTLNAIDVPTMHALDAALAAFEADDSVRAIVVTGAGERAFVAGGDIADLDSRRGLPHYEQFAEVIHRLFTRFDSCDKPTLGAINGWALGGGTELLLALDIRLVAEEAKLGLPEITLGLFPGAGAKELMFTGDQISAAEAVALGLCNRTVPRAKLLDETLALATRIAEKSPLVLKLLKRTLRQGLEMPLPAALAHEQAMIGLVLDSNDAHEGCRAFLEKRKAEFKGT
jgi:enoyl-CoA hydratase